MKLLFTGASSLTGYWFIKELVSAGHDVVATFQGPPSFYEGIRARRVELVQQLCSCTFDCAFGSDHFLALVASEPHWDLLCHHGANVTNYKSADFEVIAAVKKNVCNLQTVLERMKAKVILTGSVFEQREGNGSDSEVAVSPYGLSKGMTSDYFRFYCQAQDIALGKFVIANPFGPYEEARFTSFLMHEWSRGQVAPIKTPAYIRDNIHVSLLALGYRAFVEKLKVTNTFCRYAPSGYVESQGDFVQRFAAAMRSRTGWECRYEILQQNSFPEPRIRVNEEPVVCEGWSEDRAWDDLADYYQRLLS